MQKDKYSKKHKKSEVHVKKISEHFRLWLIVSAIVVFTFALFYKSLSFDFVLWDDNSYIQNNPIIRDFSFEGLKKIFTTPVLGMYNPFTILIYAVEYSFWGLDPGAFHMVNVIFHILASVAAFIFIYQLTKRWETAAIVALMFAIHPMHVSIATWVSELKTSLYAIFYFAALISYIKYIRSSYQIRYLVYTMLFFLLSLLSKPSAVTLSPMLLLLDYYLTRKFDKRLVFEKIPFFLISLLWGTLTVMTHLEVGDTIFESSQDYSFVNNLLVSNYALVFYFNKLLVPLQLCTIYPYPDDAALLPFKYYFSIFVIPFIIWMIYKSGSFRKEMIFGILFFAISISVVLRIVPSGFFRASNVYSYMSYTGLFFVIGQFFSYIIRNQLFYTQKIKNYFIAGLVALIVFYTARAIIRINVWENSLTLFNDIILKKPNLALAYNTRGLAKINMGDKDGAMTDFTKSIELDSDFALAYNSRGNLLFDRKDYNGALQDLNKALSIDSGFAMAYKNRSSIKLYLNDGMGALHDLNKAISLNPQYSDAYVDRGVVKARMGKLDESLKDFNLAIKANPENADAYANRSITKMELRDTLGSQEDAAKAEDLRNDESPDIH